jgi:hypothetical protein
MKHGPRQNEARLEAAAAAAGVDSQTRTIENPLASPASPGGSFKYTHGAGCVSARF